MTSEGDRKAPEGGGLAKVLINVKPPQLERISCGSDSSGDNEKSYASKKTLQKRSPQSVEKIGGRAIIKKSK